MSIVVDTREHNAASGAFPQKRQFSGDWDGLIYRISSFIGVVVTFMLGIVAIFLTFDSQGRIELLSESMRPNLDISARLADVEKKAQELQIEQREAQIVQGKLASRIAETASDLTRLAGKADRFADETESRLAASDAHLEKLDQQFSQLQLRLEKYDDAQQGAMHIVREPTGESSAPRVLADPAQKPAIRLSRFSVVRLDGRAAWIAAPEGWFHVAVGEKLPGGATVLDVRKESNRVAVITDKGIIASGR